MLIEHSCRVELLGELRLRQGERVTTRFRTLKTASLLAYLALRPQQVHTREMLIDLFWPDLDIEAGRDNLSTTLGYLRRQLETDGAPPGTFLLANRQTVQLNPEHITTDVQEFQQLLEKAARTEGVLGKSERLCAALALYRGDLLRDFYDDWILPEQTRLRERYTNTLEERAAHLEEAGELDAALELAQRAVQADPYREEAYRSQMRLYAALGRPAVALETYAHLDGDWKRNSAHHRWQRHANWPSGSGAPRTLSLRNALLSRPLPKNALSLRRTLLRFPSA